jgi:hypothetical protein
MSGDYPDISVPGAEIRLWSAVIAQALHDATCPHETDEARQDRDDARCWLTGNDTDFSLVCHLAGLEPDAVCEAVLKMAALGWPHKKPARTRVTNFDDHEELENA